MQARTILIVTLIAAALAAAGVYFWLSTPASGVVIDIPSSTGTGRGGFTGTFAGGGSR